MASKFPYQNQVIITGRLVRDPEFRSTQKGTTVCFFDIASNRRYKDQATGEWKDDTTFVPVNAWGQIADRCKDKIKKGTPVYIEGRLAASEYTNKEGNKVRRLKIVVNKIQILETTKEDSKSESDAIESENTDKASESDEEIPF
ncbi:MAG: single-stranded DNA-binding protein [Elusimicrobiales bacterium]